MIRITSMATCLLAVVPLLHAGEMPGIQEACEEEIASYGIEDPNEYQALLQECLDARTYMDSVDLPEEPVESN
jgi:hypothetical protein